MTDETLDESGAAVSASNTAGSKVARVATGALIATLVAGMFGCGGAPVPATTQGATPGAKIKCMGINACKGQADCGGIGDATCAASNACKGQGWIRATEEDCAAKGGKVL